MTASERYVQSPDRGGEFPGEMYTVLASLPSVVLPSLDGYSDPVQMKKLIRQEISVEHTTEDLGFMHGALVAIDNRSYVLAGCSGSGKSAYADHLGGTSGASTLANDWVAIERMGDDFYVSGLDWRESLKQRERRKLSGVIFLTNEDEHGRDAYVPNTSELRHLVDEAFDTATPAQTDRLHQFWAVNQEALPFSCAVPVCRATEAYTAQTITDVIRKSMPSEQTEVGVIGMGQVGTALAFQLGQLAAVSRVHLYSLTRERVVGLALDMNQAAGEERFVAHQTLEDVLAASSATFLSFRTDRIPADVDVSAVPERWLKLAPHLDILRRLVLSAANLGYDGTLFTITNPVDILTYAAHNYGQRGNTPLRTYQSYGVGLGVDVSRANFYARQLSIPLDAKSLQVYGNHSDTIVLESGLSTDANQRLVEALHHASEDVRSHGPRTVYAPVAAATRAYQAYTSGGEVHLTAPQDGAYIGQKLRFRRGLPRLPDGLFSTAYDRLVQINREHVAQLGELFG